MIMRHLPEGWKLCFAVFLAALLTSCANQSQQLEPVTAVLQNGGCINKSLDSCIGTLQRTMAFISPNQISQQLSLLNRVDINGKRTSLNEVSFVTRLPNVPGDFSANIKVDDKNFVRKASAILAFDPSSAKTADEFARTGLYEMSTILLGSECQALTRDKIEKFFYNEVRPKLVKEKNGTTFRDASIDKSYSEHVEDLNFCGRKFSFYLLFGHDSAFITHGNLSGAYMSPSISFE